MTDDAKRGEWTPEPWRASHAPDGSGIPGWNIFGADKYCVCCMTDIGRAIKLNPPNAARIVSCVNACAGLNPAALAGLVEAAEKALDALDTATAGQHALDPGRVELHRLQAALDALKAKP